MSISSTIRRNSQTIKCFVLAALFPKKYVVYRASLRIKKGKATNNNWGDDINPILIEFLSGRRALFLPNSWLSRTFCIKNYLVVGSTLTFYPLRNSHVWGAGIINDNKIDQINTKPLKISAVRGPLTRAALLEKKIECPAVYGDPALLFPFFYSPSLKRERKVGIIPHFIDVNESSLTHLLSDERTKFIEVRGYSDWKSFIDEICSSEFVISSSLHGVIIAEAYRIPCIWAEFGTYIDGWEFKFHDFFESIGKHDVNPVIIDKTITIDKLRTMAESWEPGEIDLKKLAESCPFINEKILTSIIKMDAGHFI